MNAIVYSEYPKQLVENKIIPELKEYGINVLKTISNPSGIVFSALKEVDVIFYMNELTNHNSYNAVRRKAQLNGLKLCCISRKSSGWEKQFKETGLQLSRVQNMINGSASNNQTNKDFSEKNLEFFRKYIELRNQKYSNKVIAKEFGLTEPTLYVKLNRAKHHPNCPKFLKDYFERPQIKGTSKKSSTAPVENNTEPVENKSLSIAPEKPVTEKPIIADDEVKLLLDVAETEVKEAKNKLDQIKKFALSIKDCSDLNILNHEAALIKLCDFIINKLK